MLNCLTFGDPGPAPTVLIAHGLFGSARNWSVICKRLSDRGRVVAVDMRNHGASFHSDEHTYPAMAQDLAGVIDSIGSPVDVIGHSMGGKAAMQLALDHPDKLRRIVVGDIAPVRYTHSQQPFIEAMRRVDLTGVTRRTDAARQLADFGVEPALQSFFTQSLDVATRRWRLNLDALEQNMPDIMGFPETDGVWKGPALFLSGALSDYVLPEHRSSIRRLFPAARFAKIPGAGHWLHADKPREFEAALRVFLDFNAPPE
ncbi:MAG: alpha/beta fold hydrolase [Arenibacterium sp.]